MTSSSSMLLVCAVVLTACEETPIAPSDDPFDYDVDTSVEYDLVVSPPRWVVPSAGLPAATPTRAANNNVAITLFEDRLFMAWRTSATHFADADTTLYVVSSRDSGQTWLFELEVSLGTDLREPLLYDAGGRLYFVFFEAGTDLLAFEPNVMWRTRRRAMADWTALQTWGEAHEVPWDVKRRGGRLLLTTYLGNHYGPGPSDLEVRFYSSRDGRKWTGEDPVSVYRGGASEAAFELDVDGSLWAVLRNEDGDASGFGSLVCHAPASDLGNWDCPTASDPNRYDSPRVIRHGDDLYLLARRDVPGPYDLGMDDLSLEEQRSKYLISYSRRPKRTAIYRIDPRAVTHLTDLPSAGDTAFPSVRRTGTHTFLVANYTSPLDDPDRSWLEGQVSRDGTSIYLLDLTFVPRTFD